MSDIFNLKLNHIGIVIDSKEMSDFDEKFIFDPIQSVHVLFKYSKINKCCRGVCVAMWYVQLRAQR